MINNLIAFIISFIWLYHEFIYICSTASWDDFYHLENYLLMAHEVVSPLGRRFRFYNIILVFIIVIDIFDLIFHLWMKYGIGSDEEAAEEIRQAEKCDTPEYDFFHTFFGFFKRRKKKKPNIYDEKNNEK